MEEASFTRCIAFCLSKEWSAVGETKGSCHPVELKSDVTEKAAYEMYKAWLCAPVPHHRPGSNSQAKDIHVLKVLDVDLFLVLGQRRPQVAVLLYDQLGLGLCTRHAPMTRAW